MQKKGRRNGPRHTGEGGEIGRNRNNILYYRYCALGNRLSTTMPSDIMSFIKRDETALHLKDIALPGYHHRHRRSSCFCYYSGCSIHKTEEGAMYPSSVGHPVDHHTSTRIWGDPCAILCSWKARVNYYLRSTLGSTN